MKIVKHEAGGKKFKCLLSHSMLNYLKKLFGFGTTESAPAKVEAPYKVEAPTVKVESTPYKVPEPAATTPIPLVVEPVVKAIPAKAKAPAKPKAKAPAKAKAAAPKKPRATKSKLTIAK